MVSTYNNAVTQYPCFCVPYLEGAEPTVLKPQPYIWELQLLLNRSSPSRSRQTLTKWLSGKIILYFPK
jgi:hypothetical protein